MVATPSSAVRRSALYVPCDKPRAMAKAETLASDIIIFDLEDAVAPAVKADAREALREHFRSYPDSPAERVVRINDLNTEWGSEDLMAARACLPDGIALPKVDHASDIQLLREALTETDAPETLGIWIMAETARGVLDIRDIISAAISETHPLNGLILGTNDLFKETGIGGPNPRSLAHPWLMQLVLAAKAFGITSLDGVYNDFQDETGFQRECIEGSNMGFDGKTLIHPNQIDTANSVFSPSEGAVIEAQKIVRAFAQPGHSDKGVISVDGKMVERLHLEQAKALLIKSEKIKARC